MSDIFEELITTAQDSNLHQQAADEIESLRQRVKELEESLKLAASIIGHPDDDSSIYIAEVLAAAPKPVAWMNKHNAVSTMKTRNSDIPLYTAPTIPKGWQNIPYEAISHVLAEVMDIAVSNGANSVSMPDEYVEIAAWLFAAPKPEK